MSSSYTNTVDHELGFILELRPWKETSLRVDAFTQSYGRKTLIARGARRATSLLRGNLIHFVPLSLSWFGKGSLLTLHQSQWVGGYPLPKDLAMLSAWYVNELLFKLLPLDDPYPKLFLSVKQTMHDLATQKEVGISLRKFEWCLLRELGLAPSLKQDSEDQPIQANKRYWVQLERNLEPVEKQVATTHQLSISGRTLINIGQDNYADEVTKLESKAFFQFLIEGYIPKNILITSRILRQLFEF